MKTTSSKITPQKLPWVVLGIMIIIASVLQVITYYSYAKLDNAVQTFIADVYMTEDDAELEQVFTNFVEETRPTISTSRSEAGVFGAIKNFFTGGGKSGGGTKAGPGATAGNEKAPALDEGKPTRPRGVNASSCSARITQCKQTCSADNPTSGLDAANCAIRCNSLCG